MLALSACLDEDASPTRITFPEFAGYQATSGVIGEEGWRTYFRLWTHTGDGSATGWLGDRFAILRKGDAPPVTVFATNWDTKESARTFYKAYLSTYESRFGKPKALGGNTEHPMSVQNDGLHVFIVDGPDDRGDLLERLRLTTTFAR